MGRKFDVLCCDPPWPFDDKISMSDVARGALANYNTMTIADIKSMRINELAAPDGCILCLWVPSSLLQEGLDTMKAWGFTQKQTYIWAKTKKEPMSTMLKEVKKLIKVEPQKILKDIFKKIIDKSSLSELMLVFGMGRLFRQTHEICLIGINNNGIYKKLANKSQRSVTFAENLGHSIKPETLQDSLELMFPDTKMLEVFARRDRVGWTCIGNECPSTFGEDIRDSIDRLIKEDE